MKPTRFLNPWFIKTILTVFIATSFFLTTQAQTESEVKLGAVWIPDNGDNTYTNPVLYADYSDPDIVRVGEDFYMVSSSFNCAPGVPVLHSNDLVNWTIVGHVFDNQPPYDVYDEPGHGVGVWAPSIRYHNGEFYVCYADPDFGIYMAKASNPAGPWNHKLLQSAYGWIDPCPFWDDNDSAYIVHAYAKSRIGYNSILTLRRMSPDGEKLYPEDSTMIFDGNDPDHPRPTLEGPKMYKRNGYYYIFAPFGGVRDGDQAVFRSSNIDGPYKDSTVLERGVTSVNGPHQGGWVELESGESWFMHFQEKLPYGRIVHLQPVQWINDWPYIGQDLDGDGIGEPVATWTKPDVGKAWPVNNPQTSDLFNTAELGMQWQWHSNPDSSWWSLSENPGKLRLYAATLPQDYKSLWDVGSMLLQKLPAEKFSAKARLSLHLNPGETAGLVVMGQVYSYIGITANQNGAVIRQRQCTNASSGGTESTVSGSESSIDADSVILAIHLTTNGKFYLSYSLDGIHYPKIGNAFTADEGKWIGAKVGLFCNRPFSNTSDPGFVDVDWFSVDEYYDRPPAVSGEPDPEDGEMEVDPDTYLSWTNADFLVDSFDIFLDTSPGSEFMATSLVSHRYRPGDLEEGETYYWHVDARNQHGSSVSPEWHFTVEGSSGIETNSLSDPVGFRIGPTIFSEMTTLLLELAEENEIGFKLYDGNGRLVRIMEKKTYSTGNHKIPLVRESLPEGLYLIRMEAGTESVSRKIIISNTYN